MSVIASATKFLRLHLLAWQWCGTLLLFLIACAWLQVPDSHVWQFALSVVLAAVWIFLVLWFYARTFARLDAGSTAPTIRLMVIFVVAVAVFCIALNVFDLGRAHESVWAGYWNSRLSAHARATFTYERLRLWQEWLYCALTWLLLALLLPLTFTAAVMRKFQAVVGSISYWIVALLAWLAGCWITGKLLQWMPGKSATAQIVSLGGRLLVGYTVDIFLWCVVLATMAAAVAEKTATSHPD